VLDVETTEDGVPYMVMEFLDGHDLSTEVEKRGQLSVVETVEHVLQTCNAMREAHRLGIVHRDLKPSNLFLTTVEGRAIVKVLDFGISKVDDDREARVTGTQTTVGTPLYMSPEQIRSAKSVDHRSDQWALGVILYELLAGRAPFGGETIPEVSVKIAMEPPPPLSAARGDVPPALEAVILRCLEKDRERRFANVADLAQALLPYAPRSAHAHVERIRAVLQAAGLAGAGVLMDSTVQAASAPLPLTGSSGSSVSTGTSGAFGRTAPPVSRRRTFIALASAAALLGAGALAFKLFVTPVAGDAAASAVPAVAASPTPPSATAEPPSAPRVEPLASASPPALAPSASAAPAPSEPAARAGRLTRAPRPTVKQAVKPEPAPASAPKPQPAKPESPERGLFDDRKL
jgi:serine/threonine-protein kinase